MIDATAWLREWFAKKAPEKKLSDSDNYFEVEAVDSLGVIELIEDIEATFKIRFSERDFQDRRFPSIAGLTEIIVDKGTIASV